MTPEDRALLVVIGAHFEWEPDPNVGDVAFVDLGLDSLGLAELVGLIESERSLLLEDDVLENATCINDVLATVARTPGPPGRNGGGSQMPGRPTAVLDEAPSS